MNFPAWSYLSRWCQRKVERCFDPFRRIRHARLRRFSNLIGSEWFRQREAKFSFLRHFVFSLSPAEQSWPSQRVSKTYFFIYIKFLTRARQKQLMRPCCEKRNAINAAFPLQLLDILFPSIAVCHHRKNPWNHVWRVRTFENQQEFWWLTTDLLRGQPCENYVEGLHTKLKWGRVLQNWTKRHWPVANDGDHQWKPHAQHRRVRAATETLGAPLTAVEAADKEPGEPGCPRGESPAEKSSRECVPRWNWRHRHQFHGPTDFLCSLICCCQADFGQQTLYCAFP